MHYFVLTLNEIWTLIAICIIDNEGIIILRVNLSEIANISTGHPFRKKIPQKPGSDIRVVQMKNISADSGICWGAVLETELAGKKEPNWLVEGDVLFVARGSRNYAVIVDQLKGQVVAAPHFYILRVKNQFLLPAFLVWQLNQKPLQNDFDRAAEGSFTKSLRRSVLEKALITIPSIEKQKQIVRLHLTLLEEKRLYAELAQNADKLMNAIAREVIADQTLNLREEKI